MNDLELKLGLAKLLPDKIDTSFDGTPRWLIAPSSSAPPRIIKDTEWLHICRLLEQSLDGTNAASDYVILLKHVIAPNPPRGFVGDFRFVNASWQQRATALLKIIPVEVASNKR